MCISLIVFAKWHPRDQRHSAVSCAKTAKTIDLPFGLLTEVGRRMHKFTRIPQLAPMFPTTVCRL